MRLRSQLALAFLLLSVVPLLGLTVSSYLASEQAFRRAVESESNTLAEELSQRLSRTRTDLSRRLERLGRQPLVDLVATHPEEARARQAELKSLVDSEMGDVAPFLSGVEFVPMAAPPPPPSKGHPRRPAQPAPPAPPRVVRMLSPEAEAEAAPTATPELPEAAAREAMGREAQAAQKMIEAKTRLAATVTAQVAAALRKARQEQASAGASPAEVKALDWVVHVAEMAESGLKQVKPDDISKVFGREFVYTFKRGGADVGQVRPQLKPAKLMAAVLAGGASKGAIPFAVDQDGQVHTGREQDKAKLAGLPLPALASGQAASPAPRVPGDWVVATRKDPESGLTLGIARPLGEGLREIRATSARNLALGLGAVGLALLGILPLSGRMTRQLEAITAGAERLAHGDLGARVSVPPGRELGRLAHTFNRMAEDLARQREELVEQERLRKELEMCRRIQEELLPHEPLRAPFLEAHGVSLPAREVGGDFFNYFPLPSGETALLVGDVSGKGVPAALLMANLQATLKARVPLQADLAVLAEELDQEIEASTPRTSYVTLFLGLVDPARGRLRYVNAGHNPPLYLPAQGEVETLPPTGRPLGLLAGGGYEERTLTVAGGGHLFLYTDGLVEAESASGEPFGAERLREAVEGARELPVARVLERVEEAARAHREGREPDDDATLLVLRLEVPGRA
jgi:serine phosphatase RsbU (regulator of sigma subunit)